MNHFPGSGPLARTQAESSQAAQAEFTGARAESSSAPRRACVSTTRTRSSSRSA